MPLDRAFVWWLFIARSLIKARAGLPVNRIRQTNADGTTKSLAQPRLAVMQGRDIQLVPFEGLGGAVKGAVELRPVIRNEQQVRTRVERFDNGRAEMGIDRPHHQIVGDDDTLVIPFPDRKSVV